MKIHILGSSGMLGRYIATYFKYVGYETCLYDRSHLDATCSIDTVDKFIKTHTSVNDVIVNCIGVIKPRIPVIGVNNTIHINGVFPHILADACKSHDVKMIHPTTDCVYTGHHKAYDEDSVFDVEVGDVYGLSKALGDSCSGTVIRSSIIGDEIGQSRSLVEWLKSERGNTIKGFNNHLWNGVTCLQFAKNIEFLHKNDMLWTGIKHVHSNTVSKYEIADIVNDVYELDLTIIDYTAPQSIDRTISTKYTENLAQLKIPSLKQQIQEMKQYYPVLRK
jgi:dTDP-4-dehydrorhamnose reductase